MTCLPGKTGTELRIGVVSVQGPGFHPNRRLGEAAAQRGHAIELINPFAAGCGLGQAGPTLLGPMPDPPRVILPRVGSTISPFSLVYLRHLVAMGRRLVNGPEAIALASHQFLTLQALIAAGLPAPPSHFVNSPGAWAQAAELLGGYPLVMKLASGRQGRGVSLLKDRDQAGLARKLTMRQRRGVLLQRYYPPQGRRDYRVFVVGGEVTAAVELTPPDGDFRSNVHLGGLAREVSQTGEEGRLALKAAAALGLEIAGVDLMRAADGHLMVVELNYSAGFQGLEKACQMDVAGMMVDYVVSLTGGDED